MVWQELALHHRFRSLTKMKFSVADEVEVADEVVVVDEVEAANEETENKELVDNELKEVKMNT